MKKSDNENSKEPAAKMFSQSFFHGTKADLKIGDLIEIGYSSNYGKKKKAKYIYLSATLDAAIWGAELAVGERERIYIVEPTGPIEDDPNLTDKKFPGNPTKSYRSLHPFRVIAEVSKWWQGHSPEQLKAMKDHLAKLDKQGIEAIEE